MLRHLWALKWASSAVAHVVGIPAALITVLAELELDQVNCTAVVTQLAESKGLSRRTAQRTVQQAYALIREDIDQCNVERTDLVAQAIHLLMESARMGLAQNNPGAVVGAVSQLDKLCGLSPSRR